MSEHNCSFCRSNMTLAYYCEECGSSFCSECVNEEKIDLFVCQDCSSKHISQNAEGKKICKDCGSESISKISERLKSCPKCKSPLITNIYEKKEELEKQFLDLIKDTRSFVKPLREIVNQAYIYRQKVKKARDPPIKCYHYPKIESELLALFKLIHYIKSNLVEKINLHFRHLGLNKEYFFDIYNQPNSNIRIIEDIIDNLYGSFNSIEEFLSSNKKEFETGIAEIQEKLHFIEKIKNYFASYKRRLNLAEDEKPIYAINAKLANGLNNQDSFKKNKGVLFITNFDLSFIHEHGLMKKRKELIFKAPVEDLIKIREKGKIFKRLYIEFAYGRYEFSLPSKTIPKMVEYILLARDFDKDVIYDKDSAKLVQEIEIDLNDLINYIEEGINSFFSLKCQYNTRNLKYQRNFQNVSPNYSHVHSAPLPQYEPTASNYFEENYYIQNAQNPDRLQNYDPARPCSYGRPTNCDWTEERQFLMKHLGKAQKVGHQTPSHLNNNPFGQTRNRVNPDLKFPSSDIPFQNINNSHLTDFFNSNDNECYTEPISYDRDNRKRLIELKREHFGLKETLKKLDDKFDQGNISEVDYFRTFKNLQKELYLIEVKIKKVSAEIKEEQNVRRNLNSKRYIS